MSNAVEKHFLQQMKEYKFLKDSDWLAGYIRCLVRIRNEYIKDGNYLEVQEIDWALKCAVEAYLESLLYQ